MEPLEITPAIEFDDTKHTIDIIAQEYLKQTSKNVQHLVPIRIFADGNCLFHSMVSLIPDRNISHVELRVRTIVELVKNKAHYINQYSHHVGPFNAAIQRICNNNVFSELYELAALASVLNCEVQSVYPYIDYRPEMKIMNAVYKPVDISTPSNGRVIIFWSSTEDEVSTRARPGNCGIWNPNHFVPLVHQHRSVLTINNENMDYMRKRIAREGESEDQRNARLAAQRKRSASDRLNRNEDEDQRNARLAAQRKRKASNRSNENEDQRNARLATQRRRSASDRLNEIEDEDQRNARLAAQRKRKASNRSNENEDQRNTRLGTQRRRSASDRLNKNEDEDQRNARLAAQRKRKASNRSNENEEERHTRLTKQRERSATYRLSKSKQEKTPRRMSRQQNSEVIPFVRENQRTVEQHQGTNIQRQQQVLIDQYKWPAAIPTDFKEYCLEDFCNNTSMSVLRQSICMICNIRASANTMREYDFQNIPSLEKLSCHTDLMDIIAKTLQVTESGDFNNSIVLIDIYIFFVIDEETRSIFCSSSNAVFYKKGYNTLSKTGSICQECFSALVKDKVPMFSVANKMWIGDVPFELQQLTIAEETLISLYRHNSCVVKLQSPFHHYSTAQSALKGNVITFMHDMPNIVTSLPLNVDDLCDTLKIVFIGAHVPSRIELRRLPDDDVPESIWATIERIENTIDANAERAGFTNDPLADAIIEGEPNATNAYPMNVSAVLDVNGTTVTSRDIGVHLLHKVKNTSTSSLNDTQDTSVNNIENEDVYVIPRSHMPVNDCYNSELFLGLFPTLFPYGFGAPYDLSRPTAVSLNQHIRYLLAHEDQRFEKHHSFMFVMFNILQRRQACWNASLMASRPYFQDAATDLQTLTTKEIEAALLSATKNTFSSIANPRISLLMKQIRAVGGNVMGSAYSRSALRTQIHALIFNQGLPSIFMTINPADIHSRIALYFAGVDLDLDKILPETIPSTYERAQIIAAHPVATARFFYVLISSILKCLVEKGVLGPIKAYFGTVENQGRGSLHLHILLWLDHDLTPSQLKESVRNEEFRNGLLSYLEDIIKQDLSSFTSDTSETDIFELQESNSSDSVCHTNSVSNDIVIETANESSKRSKSNATKLIPSLMPTPKPSMPNFASYFKRDAAQLVCSSNVHIHTATCYKYSKKNDNPKCRMRMPRRIENVSSIDIESGEIKLKRLHETINNFNEYIISACRSNMDIKYIFSGSDAKALYRSASLDDMCLYDYIRFYRKKLLDTKDRKQLHAQSIITNNEPRNPRRGRPVSEREPFQSGHPQASSHINIKRMKPVVPVLLGPPIPRRDREDTRERYCRSVLTLFFPWRSFQNVCDVDQTWEQAFEIRHERITSESRKIIDNIQLLQECKNDRDEHLQQVIEAAQTEIVNDPIYPNRNDSDSDDENNEILDLLENIDMSEIPALREPGGKPEQIYFEKIVRAVDQTNRFASIHRTGSTKSLTYATKLSESISIDERYLVPATTELIQLNNKWQRQIKDEKERRRKACMIASTENTFREQDNIDENQNFGGIDPGISSNFDNNDQSLNSICIPPVTKTTLPSDTSRNDIAQRFTLNKNQKAAFMIVTGHLDGMSKTNETDKQDQLIMCVPGCGGTGKSQLIRAITAYFTETNRAHKLRKLAPTSVAAAEIEGMTIHSFLGDGRNRKTKSKVMNRPGHMTLENAWRFVEYIILDEMSMVGLSLLARLSKLVTTAKHCDPMTPMGGINIILFGDYIQYSPVFDKPLYHDFGETMNDNVRPSTKVSTENEIQQKSARALILQINCVVVLEQQMRTKDLAYRALLNRVRNGDGTPEDWLLLRTRVIGIGLNISLNDPPWNEAPILVYRNELRTELNNRAVINKAYETGRSPIVLIATDTIKAKKSIDLPDLTKRLLALPDNKTEHLPGYLPLVPGMPVLLQENIACELGLSNGTQGIFRELVYSETTEESTNLDQGVFTDDTIFVRNAQYALVEIPKSKMKKLDSLDPLIIPIPVIDKTFEVNLEKLYADKGPIMKMLNTKKLKTTINVKRRGLPLVPAYSITTHKSQGQTLSKIVIDLNMPPGIVEVASAYVPLSRVQQLTDLVILQDFNIAALQVKPSRRQIAEINRLAVIFEDTKRRYPDYFA
ncbi:unnamed protein product [Adineta steineri]|uniref:ATP-dependent DNA helicase n=1 Tax=Adineta steineri TaxID=433720 RepID=A0A819MGW7_9BILA|nr:unnamed protein product [Adineta steineri]CAF1245853.1 unnamed protein product [Adineta steineri]CAF3980411.1 unnamed protein product [Adineta steineri]